MNKVNQYFKKWIYVLRLKKHVFVCMNSSETTLCRTFLGNIDTSNQYGKNKPTRDGSVGGVR